MNKYFVFRKMLDFVADHAEVIDADMNNYCGKTFISGDDGEHIIEIEVCIKEKEAKEE